MSPPSITPYFLVGCAALFTLGYGLPLTFVPLAWARVLGWEVREDALTIYRGRCLGCVILSTAAVTARVAWQPAAQPILLELLVLAFASMSIVHLVGWIRRTQPLLETLELPGYAVLTAGATWLRWG